MKVSDYKRLKRDVERRYQEALEKAKNERTESLLAIDKVWELERPRSKKNGTNTSSSDYGSLIDTVRKSLEYVPQRFTKKDILLAMQQVSSELASTCNKNSLAGCLHRLKTKGDIVEVTKGKGSKPTEYELVSKNIETNTLNSDNK